MEYAVALLLLLLLVGLVVTRPLRPGTEPERADDEQRMALEVAKESKYREIRDAELDLRMGKLSEEDHRRTDRELRAQAVAILAQLDELESERDPPPRP